MAAVFGKSCFTSRSLKEDFSFSISFREFFKSKIFHMPPPSSKNLFFSVSCGEVSKVDIHFRGIFLKKSHIGLKIFDPVKRHASFDSPQNSSRLVV
jgi:hypothetical protein